MGGVTKYHPHDYLPGARHDALLPAYDMMARLLGMKHVYATLIAQAELEGCGRVLEIGCGTGNLTTRVKRAYPGIDIVGCDPDPIALTRAGRKARGLSGIRLDQGYAQRLPYADGEFDRVLSSMMLHHLDGDAKTSAAAEAFRVLRPGGRLHLVDLTRDATAQLLRSAGFECTEVATRRLRVVGDVTYYRADRSRP